MEGGLFQHKIKKFHTQKGKLQKQLRMLISASIYLIKNHSLTINFQNTDNNRNAFQSFLGEKCTRETNESKRRYVRTIWMRTMFNKSIND